MATTAETLDRLRAAMKPLVADALAELITAQAKPQPQAQQEQAGTAA